ncbi:MAG: phage distal tail protein [Actinomycetota bacterium]
MALGDLLTQATQIEIWRSDTDRLLIGKGTSYTIEEIEGLGVPDLDDRDIPLMSDHGAAAGLDLLNSRPIRANIHVKGTAGADILGKMQVLAKMFRPQRVTDSDAFLALFLPGLPKVRFGGRPRRASWNTDVWIAVGFVRASWEFVALDPVAYALTQASQVISIGAGSTSNTGTVTMGGDFRSRPILEIQGPATNPRISNAADANRQVKIDIALLSSETLIVDVAAKTATVAGVDKYGSVRTDNQWFDLLPGANLLTFSRSTTTGVANLTVKSRDAWVAISHA